MNPAKLLESDTIRMQEKQHTSANSLSSVLSQPGVTRRDAGQFPEQDLICLISADAIRQIGQRVVVVPALLEQTVDRVINLVGIGTVVIATTTKQTNRRW